MQFKQLFSELCSVSPNHLALDSGMAKVQTAGFNLSNAAFLKRARTAAMEDVKFGRYEKFTDLLGDRNSILENMTGAEFHVECGDRVLEHVVQKMLRVVPLKGVSEAWLIFLVC
jgi:hypothetical protein